MAFDNGSLLKHIGFDSRFSKLTFYLPYSIEWEGQIFKKNRAYADNQEKSLDFKDVKIGEWVLVIYEDKKFLRKVFWGEKW